METFGRKVRQAVESQGLPLDEVAEATGLGIEHIQALERDDFGALPGDDIVREGLRSFARLVGVDSDEVIADYNRERQRWLAALPAEVGVAGVRDTRDQPKGIDSPRRSGEPQVAAEPSRPRSGRNAWVAILASAILALVVVTFHFWSRSSTPPASAQLPVARDTAPMRKAAAETPDFLGASAGRTVSPTDTPSRPPDSMGLVSAIKPTNASGLSIRESGVGRGVVRHQLVGEAEQFTEGERVWFWTLIEGGTAGDSVDHIWFHEGAETLRVLLSLGGARWRTQSYKDLNPGSEGNWVVEARDEAGRVLARREFLCSPRR